MGMRCRVKHVGTVEDIEDRDDLTLVNSEEDILAIAESIGIRKKNMFVNEFGSCYVSVIDGDYGEVFCSQRNIPHLSDPLYKVDCRWVE